MKNLYKTLALALLLASTALFTSCNPENILAKNLEGTWDFTSFTVDGVELIGAGVVSGEFDFDEYDGDEGDFSITIVFSSGQTTVSRGEYELNADGDEVELMYDVGGIEQYDVEVEDDEATFEANLDGELYRIRAEKD